jgi:hypothetical protein
MKNKLTGITWIGIIYTYLISSLGAFFWLGLSFNLIGTYNEWQFPLWIGIGTFHLITVVVVLLFNLGMIKSRIIPGFLATLSNLIGGILILINKNDENTENNLEYKLNEIKKLLAKDIISEEEYRLRREAIIKG